MYNNFTQLGLGTSTIASYGRSLSLNDAKKLFDTAFDYNIRTIDTSDTYGSGDTERLIGKVIKNKRNNSFIISKVGVPYLSLPAILSAKALTTGAFNTVPSTGTCLANTNIDGNNVRSGTNKPIPPIPSKINPINAHLNTITKNIPPKKQIVARIFSFLVNKVNVRCNPINATKPVKNKIFPIANIARSNNIKQPNIKKPKPIDIRPIPIF